MPWCRNDGRRWPELQKAKERHEIAEAKAQAKADVPRECGSTANISPQQLLAAEGFRILFIRRAKERNATLRIAKALVHCYYLSSLRRVSVLSYHSNLTNPSYQRHPIATRK